MDTPGMHEAFEMGARVSYSPNSKDVYIGTLIGVAHKHVFFTYILLLDEPITLDGEIHKAISAIGTLIKRIY